MTDIALPEADQTNTQIEQRIAELTANPLFRIFQKKCEMHAGFVANNPRQRDGAYESLRQFAHDKLSLDAQTTEYMIARAMNAVTVPEPAAPPLQPDAQQSEQAATPVEAQEDATMGAESAPAAAEPRGPAPGGMILPATSGSLDITSLDRIAPEAIDWLWPGRIALGRVIIIAGDPGLGKSQAALAIAAAVTRGGPWPHGEGQAALSDVIVMSAEDSLTETVRPRFDAAGGDPARMHVIRAVIRDAQARGFDLAEDLALLERELVRRPEVRLVIVDPVTAYVKGNGQRMREVLTPIGAVAERWRVAVLLVTHLSKARRKAAVHNMLGSVSLGAVARAVFLVGRDPQDESRRLFLEMKNNLAQQAPGLAFRLASREIGPGLSASHVVWEDATVDVSAEAILNQPRKSESNTAMPAAVEFLLAMLADGPKPVREIQQEAVRAGLLANGVPVSQAHAMRAARERLGVRSIKKGMPGEAGEWMWALPREKPAEGGGGS